MHPHTRASLSALFGFVTLALSFVLMLQWGWSMYQAREQLRTEHASGKTDTTLSTSAVHLPAPALPPETTEKDARIIGMKTAPSATESLDAAFAHASMAGEGDVAALNARTSPPPVSEAPARLIPASLPAPERGDESVVAGAPRIAIIIDDMGLAIRNSQRVVGLPAALTLSYLPYAENIQGQVDTARAAGHEIMLHLPMEPLDRSQYPGPKALTTRLSEEELKANLQSNLNAFKGYVGINNHMGSRLTSTPAAMQVVMNAVDRRDVYFVDSWTSPRSVAYEFAANEGIPRGRRDVFLDHEEGTAFVWNALHQLERTAKRNGYAVAIGHPKAATIQVLSAWLPEAQRRGFKIVPMSRLIYSGSVAKDPVLLADQAHRAVAARASRIAPAAGK